ncbi:bifunctional adenosylcobinamide kinase/adenosylcobinamide-phosphate guanylyltransferase, partial [Bacteroides uniformis]|nr:bifunctional adenosylcobinamide kinase/adenosylcobinamide-phosphate guanylyltransferase [Bacteroides uniformis]
MNNSSKLFFKLHLYCFSPFSVFLATARIWDEEFRQRVIRHQERRGPEWT